MSLETAASIGIGLLKNPQELGMALNGLSGLGKLTGEGFSKIAAQFHLPTRISSPIAQAIDENRDPNTMNSVQVLTSMRYYDANQDGQISQAELTQGLQQLQAAGLAGTGGPGDKLYQLGNHMLQQYSKVAQLDGNSASISYKDAGKLINQDGNIATLSTADWNALNA
jgi:hypothetical protein